MAALMGFAATSCDSYKDNETPDKFVEADKDLSGVWSLTKVMRNNVDITSTMDFSKFRLRLNPDGSYSLENRLPFRCVTAGCGRSTIPPTRLCCRLPRMVPSVPWR